MVASRRRSSALSTHEEEFLQTLGKPERIAVRRCVRAATRRHEDAPLRIQVLQSAMPDAFKTTLFQQMACCDDKTVELARNVLRIPFGCYAPPPPPPCANGNDSRFFDDARAQMDRSIFGHDEAKREALVMLSQWRRGGSTPFALALEGPPGIGKTTFVKNALATVLQRPMSVICLGGACDVSMLLGHGFTYEGARHGRLVQSLIETSVMNPVIFFDELDKVSATTRGDEIINALIHLTDPQQNASLRDRYFQGLSIDFSQCILVFSYNDPRHINPILLDRLKRISLRAPTCAEKLCIARDHIVPRSLGATGAQVALSDAALRCVVNEHARDVGMRSIERCIHDVVGLAGLCCQYGDASIVGLPSMGDLGNGVVSEEFVRMALNARTDAHDTATLPPMMFT